MAPRKLVLSPEDRAARDAAQLDRFKEAARAVECDDDEQRFDDRMRKLAKAPHVMKKTKKQQ